MRILRSGDKDIGFCEYCKTSVTITYEYRNILLSDRAGKVSNILVGVCDCCSRINTIPAQSTPSINPSRKKATESLEALLPAFYVDKLDIASFIIDQNSTTEMRKFIFFYYVQKFVNGSLDIKCLRSAFNSAEIEFSLTSSDPKKRLSFKIDKKTEEDFEDLARLLKMSKTDLVKAIIGKVKRDMLDEPDVHVLEDLQTIARVAM